MGLMGVAISSLIVVSSKVSKCRSRHKGDIPDASTKSFQHLSSSKNL